MADSPSLTIYPSSKMAEPRIFLAELDGYDPDTSSVVTYRYCSGRGYQDGANWYEPRIMQPATYSRSINTEELGGKQSSSYGEMTLAAIDGAVDALADKYFDGRELRLYYGRQSDVRERFVLILRAQIDAVSVERERVSVRLRDRAVTLDKPFSTAKYAGDNELPLGLEGGPDIKDQAKPRIFGRVALMSPVMVNTAKLIYQYNDGPAQIANVFDGGAYLTRAYPDYADATAIQTEQEPDPGTYRVCPSLGYFRLGASPFAQITASVAEAWTYQTASAAGLIARVIQQSAQYRTDSLMPSGAADWHHLDMLALDEGNASSLGIVIGAEETTASVLSRICASVGAFWGFDSLGKLRVVQFGEPSATPDITLTPADMLAAEREPYGSIPPWRITLRYDRNHAVQDKSSLAGVVTGERANWLSTEYREAKAEDTGIQATRLLAEEITYDTEINGLSQAQAEAERRLALFGARRDVVSVTIAEPAYYGEDLDLGKTIRIIAPRLGYQSGRNLIVTDINIDYGSNRADLTLWG